MYLVTMLSIMSLTFIDASRILVCVPAPSVSHQVVFYPLIKELVKRGHEVVFVTADPIFPKGEAPANLTEIDTHDVSYKTWKNLMRSVTKGEKADLYPQLEFFFRSVGNSFRNQVRTPEFQDLIKNKVHFDLIIIEACAKAALSLTHVFNAPAILLSSFGSLQDNYELVGAPKYPTLMYPNCMHQKINNKTILDKIKSLWHAYKIDNIFDKLRGEENALVKELFGPNTPTLEEMGNNVHMLFMNVYPVWEVNRPVPPSVVFIGGIHQKTPKELPKNLQEYLDSSKNGVVYFCFGTNVSPSTLPLIKQQILINAFSKLKYDVLVKWDSDKIPGAGENIRVGKWLPQSDILRHPNVKAFITQGGLQSFDEALTAGVPLVGIPMVGDQWFNVELYVTLKIGVGILMEVLSEEKLVNAINTVIDDPSYKQRMNELRVKLRDQPQTALDRAVWWTEHVLRHKGASHLRAPAANMSWAEYLDIELLAVLATAAFILLAIILTILYQIVKFIRLIDISVKLKVA